MNYFVIKEKGNVVAVVVCDNGISFPVDEGNTAEEWSM